MIYEFVGFPAYEAAVESEIGLLGVLPVDASNELGIRLGRIYKLVRKGVMDLVRVTRYDGSVSLYVPLRSIRAYQTGVNKRSLPCFLTGGWRCWILTGPGVGRGLRSSCSASAQVPVLVTPGLTLTYGPCLPLSVYPACHNPYYYAWLFLVFSFPYSSLDDFKLFSAVFLKGFNFSFPAVIRDSVCSISTYPLLALPGQFVLYKRFHCS